MTLSWHSHLQNGKLLLAAVMSMLLALMPRESVYWPLAKPFWRQLSLCYFKVLELCIFRQTYIVDCCLQTFR